MQKKLVDELAERSSAKECTGNIDEVKTADENECVCVYTICVAMAVVALAIRIEISAYFAYKYINYWYLKKDIIRFKFGVRTQTTI